MASTFNRTINDTFVEQLATEAKKTGSWWADVLADDQLLIAQRGSYLNVYWLGQSLFNVASGENGLQVTTHEKFLLDPELKGQVALNNNSFDVRRLEKGGFIREYKGRETLAKIKKAAGLFSGLEKIGCHQIAVNNKNIIDVEIAFPGIVSLEDGGKDKKDPRVDLACLESDGNERARLVFWEAKHYGNGALRARDGQTPASVLRQVKIYRKYLSDNREHILQNYERTIRNSVLINNMRPKKEILPAAIEAIAAGKLKLTFDEVPKIGVIIFGFDVGQRNEPSWKKHLAKLKDNLKSESGNAEVIAIGDPKKIKLHG